MEPRKTGVEPRNTRNTRKKNEGGESMNHEWTRMEPRNTGVEPRKTRNTQKKKAGGSMNHEWNHEIQEWNHEKHEIHENRTKGEREYEPRMEPRNTGVEPRKTRNTRKRKKPVVGAVYEPRMHTNNRSRGKFPISAVPSFLLVPLTEKAVGFWVLPRGLTAFEMVCDAGLGPATSTVSG